MHNSKVSVSTSIRINAFFAFMALLACSSIFAFCTPLRTPLNTRTAHVFVYLIITTLVLLITFLALLIQDVSKKGRLFSLEQAVSPPENSTNKLTATNTSLLLCYLFLGLTCIFLSTTLEDTKEPEGPIIFIIAATLFLWFCMILCPYIIAVMQDRSSLVFQEEPSSASECKEELSSSSECKEELEWDHSYDCSDLPTCTLSQQNILFESFLSDASEKRISERRNRSNSF